MYYMYIYRYIRIPKIQCTSEPSQSSNTNALSIY